MTAILDSTQLLAAINDGSAQAPAVTYEVFDAGDGSLVKTQVITGGFGDVATFNLADNSYKIRATAEGFLESWFTASSGASDPFLELLGYQARKTFATADEIVVDTVTSNSSLTSQGWTVLHRSVSSISGAVGNDASAQAGTLMANVDVELHDASAAAGAAPVAVTQTDANGYYTFTDIAPGSYTVRFLSGGAERWWPETMHRAQAEAITLDGAGHFNLAYAVFPATTVAVDPQHALTLSGQPALGATLTASHDYAEVGATGEDCLQRYNWFIGGTRVDGAFGPTFVVPLEAGGKLVTARLDIAGIGCTYAALASNPVGPVDLSLTREGPDVVVSPVDSAGGTAVALTFGNVTTAGSTTVTRLDSGDAFPAGGFSSLTEPPLYYDIETTAVFDQDPVAETGVKVCITFDTTGMSETQAAGQHLYHFVNGAWADITDSALSATGKVCGVTYSFSPFAVGQPHWPFQGFLHPVDNGATLNAMKAGGAVPIKFGLGGNRGLDILAAGAPSSSAVACPGGTVPDDIEQTVAAGTSSLSYSASSDTYTFVWKTQKDWAGSCRQFGLGLGDGTVHTAMFDFRK